MLSGRELMMDAIYGGLFCLVMAVISAIVNAYAPWLLRVPVASFFLSNPLGWVSAALFLFGFAAGYYIAGVVGRRLGRWVVIDRD